MASRLKSVFSVPSSSSFKHSGTIIFLHGSGDIGQGIKEWLHSLLEKDFVFPHLRVVFPTAPVIPYTPFDGEPSHVWFDRKSISPKVPEDLKSVDATADALRELIDKEVADGIALNRLIIGGFSMGGAMAMHMGYRYLPQVAGVFALSSFLNNGSEVYKHLDKNGNANGLPPLFMCHGDSDGLVSHSWGEETYKQLRQRNVEGEFHTLKHAAHELTSDELLKLSEWILKRLPDSSSHM